MSRRVRSWGSLDAPILAIAEAPAKQECLLGRPLVGPSGKLLDYWWQQVGLKRSDFRLGNTFEYMAPSSKIEKADHAEVEAWASTVHERLVAPMTSPVVICPMGNVALRALLRKPLWSNKSPSIWDYRGSILKYEWPDGSGRWTKLVPTPHPAATFYDPSLSKLCRADWRRIAADSKFPELRLPQRTHLIPPIDSAWLADYLKWSQNERLVCAIDIETNPAERRILCVGFAFSKDESLTLPWPAYRKAIKQLCESPCQKVLQNGGYDCYYLEHFNVSVRNYIWDTLAMAHCLDATMPAFDLATLGSLYTRQPYWKRSHKESDTTSNEEKTPLEALMNYNGIDCCVTYEIFTVLYRLLRGEQVQLEEAA